MANDSHQHKNWHTTGHPHRHGHGIAATLHEHTAASHDGAGASHAELLDLDAEVFGSQLDEVTHWAGQYAPAVPRTVVDMGAGTGTGTVALASRFTQADVIAVDKSDMMLERVRAVADEHGLGDRVRALQADLDAGWPETGAVDVVWAASSLHEVASPDHVLAGIYAALNPGGLLVVLEIDGLPWILPDDVERARPGLETRCHEALAQQGWNAHPNWRSHLEQAGFSVAAERSFAGAADAKTGPSPSGLGRYADGYLRRMRYALGGKLDGEDLKALDRLLAAESNESLLRRDDVQARVTRTAWAAHRSQPNHSI